MFLAQQFSHHRERLALHSFRVFKFALLTEYIAQITKFPGHTGTLIAVYGQVDLQSLTRKFFSLFELVLFFEKPCEIIKCLGDLRIELRQDLVLDFQGLAVCLLGLRRSLLRLQYPPKSSKVVG